MTEPSKEPIVVDAELVDVVNVNEVPERTRTEREASTTVGTGSYVAISCTAMALLVTAVILGILFLFRWLT